MPNDETEHPAGQTPERPDPAFIKSLEDDSLWSAVEDERSERRVEREKLRSSRALGGGERRYERLRKERGSRLVAVIVLVAAALVITMVGLEVVSSMYGSSETQKTVPFSLLPLPNSPATYTTEPTTTTTSTTTTSSTTTSTTTTTVPVAAVVSR
jgi:hypothetical protein